MVELKLIKVKLIIYNRTEKLNILIPGYRLENLIPSSNVTPTIISLPHKLPMIVKPNLYLYKDSYSCGNATAPHSAVQPCSGSAPHPKNAVDPYDLASSPTENN